MKLATNKILITGGGSGIGLALTERFIQEGNVVIICGRRKEALQSVSSRYPDVVTRVCDLTSEMDRIALYEWISKEHPDLNVLVNNAGIQNWMKVTDDDFMEKAKLEITTNIEAPLHLTKLFLAVKSLDTIINVTSGLAFVPLTKTPVYSATKAFLHSFTLSLRHLLRDRSIEVIEMAPPALNTDLGGKGLHDNAPPVSDYIDAVFRQLRQGKTQLTFGFSEAMANSVPEEVKAAFARLNPVDGQ